MPYDNDFEEILDNFDFFTSKLAKRLHTEIDEIFKEIKNGKIKGTLETREVNEPGIKGYVIQGHFRSDAVPEPFEPLKPSKRRPLPERPFAPSKNALKENREPLTDIFEEEDATRIYVELPGEEKKDVHLKVTGNSIEVKTENFFKVIELPNRNIDKSEVSSKYKNGVLEITVPKQAVLPKDAERERPV